MADFHDLVGVPFEYGGRGPDSLDCYGLVMECARRDGIALPDFGSATDQPTIMAMMCASLPQWRQIERRIGAVAFVRVGRYTAHVGYVIGPDHMIHAWEDSGGVTIVRIADWQHRIIGFFEYVGKNRTSQ
jgi:cell wall-associated NlpC family hydrolase